MEKEKVLQDYLNFRRLKNHSISINDIEFQIRNFMNFTKKPLSEFNDVLLVQYLNILTSKYSTGTMNTIKSSFLKNFIKWYWLDWSSRFKNLDLICKQEKTASPYTADDMLSEADVQKLVQSEDSHFWKAYFLTLFYGGFRPSELCKLKWSKVEFDPKGGAFLVSYSNKNKESFIKYVPESVSYYLSELKSNHKEWVFYYPKTKLPLSKSTAYKKIVELSKKALGKPIDLYTLRHSIATIIYNKDGLKDDAVARQMGHTKSMKSTYVHNDKVKLKEIARQIYIVPETLPPEKKNELEKRIEILEDRLSKILKYSKKR